MAHGRRHTKEQIMSLLRQIEMKTATGVPTPLACSLAGIGEYTYYRWRGEFCGLKVDDANRLKEFEKENAKLKRLIAVRQLGEIKP
jgi:hypothetical protein